MVQVLLLRDDEQCTDTWECQRELDCHRPDDEPTRRLRLTTSVVCEH